MEVKGWWEPMNLPRLNLPVVFLAFFKPRPFMRVWLYNEFVIVRPLEQELWHCLRSGKFGWENNDRFVIKLELVSVENLKDALGEIRRPLVWHPASMFCKSRIEGMIIWKSCGGRVNLLLKKLPF